MSLGWDYLFIQTTAARKPVWKIFFTIQITKTVTVAIQIQKHLQQDNLKANVVFHHMTGELRSYSLRAESARLSPRVTWAKASWPMDSCRSPHLHSAHHMLSWTALHLFHVAANSCLTVHGHSQQSGPQQRIIIEILDKSVTVAEQQDSSAMQCKAFYCYCYTVHA